VVSCDPARLGKAGQARFVGVWCGAARIGSLRQASSGWAGHGAVRYGRRGMAW